jgi:3-hydroxybutyrate dehydrogenase
VPLADFEDPRVRDQRRHASVTRLEDQVVIVARGGKGIRAAIWRAYSKEAASVVFADRDLVPAEEVVRAPRDAGGDALAVGVDATDAKAESNMADTTIAGFGRFDVLIDNAGARIFKGLL